MQAIRCIRKEDNEWYRDNNLKDVLETSRCVNFIIGIVLERDVAVLIVVYV